MHEFAPPIPPPHLSPSYPPPPLTLGLCMPVPRSAPHRKALCASQQPALRTLEMIMGARVNDMSGPFLGRSPSVPFPNIVTLRLPHADSVYN